LKKKPAAVLGSIDILSSLSENDLEILYSHMHSEKIPRDKILFSEGDPGETMYIVLSGSISISVNTPDKKTMEIAEITEGNFFGEMSIFDSSARSATCRTKSDTEVLSLRAVDFFDFISARPEAGIIIMHRMLMITANRLQNTGAFLSDMVTWGEQARTRAITDDFTGLYNRRFLDEVIEDRFSEFKGRGLPFSIVMIDLDNFGTLNSLYGQETGDSVLKAVVPVFRDLFRTEDILARYGGDEFIFLLPGLDGEQALSRCTGLLKELRKIDILENLKGPMNRVTASIGIASYPDHADSVSCLMEFSDQALYEAKQLGRDRVILWSDKGK